MFEVTLKTLTPVHVGVSQEHWWQKGVDFFQDGENIYVVKLDDIFKKLGKVDASDIDRLTAAMSRGDTALDNFSDYLVSQRNLDLKNIAYRKFHFKDPRMKELRPVMSSGSDRTPMIPSSSIKGVIRTAFLDAQIEKNPHYAREQRNLGRKRGNRFRFSDRGLQNNYIGKDPKQDPFRFVRFSDFYFKSTECNKVQILNLERGDRWDYKRSQFTHLECLSPNQTALGSLRIPGFQIKYAESTKAVRHTRQLSAGNLCKIANKLTNQLLDYELAHWEDEEGAQATLNKGTRSYINKIQGLKQEAETCEKNACIIRVGGGSGWDFMTGGWAKDELDDRAWEELKGQLRKKRYNQEVPYPKTRKLTHEDMPMGFVKMVIREK